MPEFLNNAQYNFQTTGCTIPLDLAIESLDGIVRIDLGPVVFREGGVSGTLEGAIDFKEAIAALVQSALRDECLAAALRHQMAQIRGRRFNMGSVIGGALLVFVSTTQLDRA